MKPFIGLNYLMQLTT